jgi:rhamnosyltransferase
MFIATAVVLYYPDAGIVKKLLQYAEYVDILIVVDNTDNGDISAEFSGIPNICYRPLGQNTGIATALNIAAEIAIARKYLWMMMLDQDSTLKKENHDSVRLKIAEITDPTIGLVSPIQVSKESDLQIARSPFTTRDVSHVMTSGSTLSLMAYERCGRFQDKLFIDHVDNEYCLRLGKIGYRVVQLTQITLEHSLGETREWIFFGKKIAYASHKPFRSYYYVRNGFYVAVRFLLYRPQFFALFCINLMKAISKAIFFEDEKTVRLKMMFMGFVHFCIGRYGRL